MAARPDRFAADAGPSGQAAGGGPERNDLFQIFKRRDIFARLESADRLMAVREARTQMSAQDRADVEAVLFSAPTDFEHTVIGSQSARKLRKSYNRAFDRVITVGIGFQIIRIHQIDEASEHFTVDFDINMTWVDPSVVDVKEPDWTKAWSPMLIFRNEIDSREISRKIYVSDPSKGIVFCYLKYHATFYENLELYDFPFDRQILHIDVSSFRPTKEMEFAQFPARSNKIFAMPISQWIVAPYTDDDDKLAQSQRGGFNAPDTYVIPQKELYAASDGLLYPRARFEIRVQRRAEYYLWNVVMVIFLLVLLSATAHRVPMDRFADRMAVNLSLVLTLVAYKFTVVGALPRKHYLTWIDRYLVASFVILALQGLEMYVASMLDPFGDAFYYLEVAFQVGLYVPWILYHVFIFLFRNRMYISWAEVVRVQRIQVL
mmetsp:Transcript_18427/g.61699  ORF Transcript_18427/g.61699 Transcript_18427/m.61699 type:complete len:432 (-) Transcript_18427:191-1486(-)